MTSKNLDADLNLAIMVEENLSSVMQLLVMRDKMFHNFLRTVGLSLTPGLKGKEDIIITVAASSMCRITPHPRCIRRLSKIHSFQTVALYKVHPRRYIRWQHVPQ